MTPDFVAATASVVCLGVAGWDALMSRLRTRRALERCLAALARNGLEAEPPAGRGAFERATREAMLLIPRLGDEERADRGRAEAALGRRFDLTLATHPTVVRGRAARVLPALACGWSTIQHALSGELFAAAVLLAVTIGVAALGRAISGTHVEAARGVVLAKLAELVTASPYRGAVGPVE